MTTAATTAKKPAKKASEQKNTFTATVTLAHGEQINTRTGSILRHPTAQNRFMMFVANASAGAGASRMRFEIHEDDLIQVTESGEGKPATVVYKANPGLVLNYTGEFVQGDGNTLVSSRLLKGGVTKTTTIYPHGRRLLSFIEKTPSASSNMPSKEKTAKEKKKPAKATAAAAAE